MAVSPVRLFNSLCSPRTPATAYSTLHSRSPNSLTYESFRVKGGLGYSLSRSSRDRALDSWPMSLQRDFAGTPYVPAYVMLPVYFDFMRNFRVEFDDFFVDGVISEIEVGLGPCGELRYTSYPVKSGWKYPGIGAFQCYDKYMMKSLRKAAEKRGHTFWGRAPNNAGSYNSVPHETGFFRDGGDYDSYYGSCIAAKVSAAACSPLSSHAAELNTGFYNSAHRDGYAPIAAMLKKHEVLNAAWDVSIPVASENALPCYDREGYNKILENGKP
ncbi:Beta-amylase 2 [Hibiscus syriacus]|uniref:Beta-amylase n=1 Tax=Hibiscus syriacus TaxID=106335 RepID=A0A6A3A2Q5_HIBSY|nr:Beta-amylase 2 [Hibiscus syriacus]